MDEAGGQAGPVLGSQAVPPHLGACAHSLPSAGDAFSLLGCCGWKCQSSRSGPQASVSLCLGDLPGGRDCLGPAWNQGQSYGRRWGLPLGVWGCPPALLALALALTLCRVAVGRDGPSSGPPQVLTPGGVLGQVSWTLREIPLTPSDPVEVEVALGP